MKNNKRYSKMDRILLSVPDRELLERLGGIKNDDFLRNISEGKGISGFRLG
ncbi:MAG: hypothetical protein AB2L14_23360 [Candidatus Xenobiia bacterium LiM19]